MSKPILVTGATGLVGHGIASRLAASGRPVRALVRDLERARAILPAAVELVRGDVTEPDSIAAAVRGVELVFHAAGLPEQWLRDPGTFDRVNRGGTVNVLRAALAAGVGRVVYTSTMDVFAAPRGGTLIETNIDEDAKPTAYERSKQAAEREAVTIERDGLDVVYVNPGAIYGPSPLRTSMNGFFAKLLAGKVPLVPPGGLPMAYLDGVVDVHLAAAERGRRGERYLVADEHTSMHHLSTLILAAEGSGRRVPRRGPRWLVSALAAVSAPVSRIFGIPPLIARGELAFLLWDVRVDAGKAQRELGFVPTPLEEGVRRTVAAFAASASGTPIG